MSASNKLDAIFRSAISNIDLHGDTDVFPFPFEKHVFHDRPTEVAKILNEIHARFGQYYNEKIFIGESSLQQVGYTGFRNVTQIDPFWNAYFLALVISIGKEIEQARVPVSDETIFSYRFKINRNNGRVFDENIGWREFQGKSLQHCENYSHVLICDIADFYYHISHHRIENALLQCIDDGLDAQKVAVTRIIDMLGTMSNKRSYGLPVGGPAARLLSEIAINDIDRLLRGRGIVFCRFVDDYHIFTNSEEEAYSTLIFLNEKLVQNHGLTLQKLKTRILRSPEFKSAAQAQAELASGQALAQDNQITTFMALRLKYDPYSETASQDYEKIKSQITKFDILGMIGRELSKSRVHQGLTKHLLQALRYLDPSARNRTVSSLLQRMSLLSPVLPSLLRTIREIYDELETAVQQEACDEIKALIARTSPLMQLDINLAFALRILAKNNVMSNQNLLYKLYNERDNYIIKRDIILIMADWHADWFLEDLKAKYSTLSNWEKRAYIVASYAHKDAGRFWRKKAERGFDLFEKEIHQWAENRYQDGARSVPL